jgi:hypothetical protein
MEKEQKERVINALANFVLRVANGEATSEKEIEVLSEIASILLNEIETVEITTYYYCLLYTSDAADE